MPRVIDPGEGDAIALETLIEALDATSFDVRDEDSFAALAPLLARLGRNRGFLADLAVTELKTRCRAQSAIAGYGPQVLLLSPPGGRYLLRANFWPASDDAITKASGEAAFVYGMPHDHNFSFLTYGYFGPGYWSDYYEYDSDALLGLPGENARLRFVERARLEPGRVLLYRRSRDIHVQLPPDAFSVSLNILGVDPAQPWIDQYRFDIARGTIAGQLACAPGEALLTLAAQFCGEGRDLAERFARSHPCDRMRATALDALVAAAPDDASALLERAAGSPSAYLASHARLRLAAREAMADKLLRNGAACGEAERANG